MGMNTWAFFLLLKALAVSFSHVLSLHLGFYTKEEGSIATPIRHPINLPSFSLSLLQFAGLTSKFSHKRSVHWWYRSCTKFSIIGIRASWAWRRKKTRGVFCSGLVANYFRFNQDFRLGFSRFCEEEIWGYYDQGVFYSRGLSTNSFRSDQDFMLDFSRFCEEGRDLGLLWSRSFL